MSARTSPTIAAADLAEVIAEHYPDADVPTMPAPHLTPQETVRVLLGLLGTTPAAVARLENYRYRESAGQTLGVLLADDLIDGVAAVRLPLRVGPRPEPGPSWLISLTEARRLTVQTEMWFLPASAVLTMPFAEVELIQYPISEVEWPLTIACGVIGELADLFTREELYSAAP